jgi:hypothetical protein
MSDKQWKGIFVLIVIAVLFVLYLGMTGPDCGPDGAGYYAQNGQGVTCR